MVLFIRTENGVVKEMEELGSVKAGLNVLEETWLELDEEDRANITLDEILDERILQYFDQSGAPIVEQVVEFNPKKRSVK